MQPENLCFLRVGAKSLWDCTCHSVSIESVCRGAFVDPGSFGFMPNTFRLQLYSSPGSSEDLPGQTPPEQCTVFKHRFAILIPWVWVNCWGASDGLDDFGPAPLVANSVYKWYKRGWPWQGRNAPCRPQPSTTVTRRLQNACWCRKHATGNFVSCKFVVYQQGTTRCLLRKLYLLWDWVLGAASWYLSAPQMTPLLRTCQRLAALITPDRLLQHPARVLTAGCLQGL